MRMVTSHIKKSKSALLNLLIIAGILLTFTSCSTGSITREEEKKEKGEQTFTFSENENGAAVHYEINFNDGKIASIYKDNVKIPENEIDDYENLVERKLGSLIKENKKIHVFHTRPDSFHFDMKEFRNNMKEWKEKFKADEFNFEFDNEKFKADMEKLKENMKDLDKIVIKIDKDKIIKDLDKLKTHKFNFDFDEDEIKENLKRITIELEKSDEKLNLNMEELEKEMEELDEEMKELDKEMKILDNFLNDIKKELTNDGYINNTDEEFNLEINEDEMKIDGEKVPGSVHSKYKNLYKKHYGKEIKGKIKFQI